MPADFLSGSSGLESLVLGHNLLQELGPHQFSSLPRLRLLDLGHNNISAISGAALARVAASLHTLLLHHNNLRTLAADTLLHLPNLQVRRCFTTIVTPSDQNIIFKGQKPIYAYNIIS